MVPYEKGYLFLRALEERAGRAAFDGMLRAWLQQHRSQSVTTDDFLETLSTALPALEVRDQAGALSPWIAGWLDGHGLPAGVPRPASQRLTELRALAAEAARGHLPPQELQPSELLLFLQALPPSLTAEQCAALDHHLGLRGRRSLELRCAFLVAALRAGAPGSAELARHVLLETGRMKFLRPLYGGLAARPETRALAAQFYGEAKGRYHPIARSVIEGLLRA